MKSSRLIAGGVAAAFLLAVHDFGAGWYAVSPAGKKVERDG
jgi:hypothetical protein